MLQPKRTKFRKQFKGRIHGEAKGGAELNFGHFGLKATEPDRVTARQIEAARRALTRHMKRQGRVWIRVFPDVPVSKKPTEVRMGKGKGAVEFWAAKVKPGRIMFEIDGVERGRGKGGPAPRRDEAADQVPLRRPRGLVSGGCRSTGLALLIAEAPADRSLSRFGFGLSLRRGSGELIDERARSSRPDLTAEAFVEWAMDQPSGRFELAPRRGRGHGAGARRACAGEDVDRASTRLVARAGLLARPSATAWRCASTSARSTSRTRRSAAAPRLPNDVVVFDDPVVVVEVDLALEPRASMRARKLARLLPAPRRCGTICVVQPETRRVIHHPTGRGGRDRHPHPQRGRDARARTAGDRDERRRLLRNGVSRRSMPESRVASSRAIASLASGPQI